MPSTRAPDPKTSGDAAASRSKRGAVALLALAALGAFAMSRACATEQRAQNAPSSPAASAATQQAQAAAVAPSAAAPPLPIDEELMAKLSSVARLQEVLADYEANATYPIWSRPHDEATKYKFAWNEPSVSDLPLSMDKDKPTNFRFGADKAHVAYGESITGWLEAWEGDDDTKRIPLTIRDGWVMGVGGTKEGRMMQLQFHDDGCEGDEKAGDLRYSVRFVPSEHAELKGAQQLRLTAQIQSGKHSRPVLREFTCALSPVLVVTGITDAVKDGNLVLTLAVDAFEKGIYTFEANISSHDGAEPIGWTMEDIPLEPGKRVVDVRFFGKMFHDKGVDGPYLVTDIRGRVRKDGSSELPIPWTHTGKHMTKAFKPADMSSNVWDAPEKTAKINALKQLIADTKAGKVGQPTNAPKHIHIGEDGKETVVP